MPQDNPTPEQDWEWLLEGLSPAEGTAAVKAHIDRLQKQVNKLQITLTHDHAVRKSIENGDWPVDEDGCLTYSPDNPLA